MAKPGRPNKREALVRAFVREIEAMIERIVNERMAERLARVERAVRGR